MAMLVRGYCRPNEKRERVWGVCLFFTSGLQVSSLLPKMMALSKTVETMCIFQPCRESKKQVRRSPRYQTLPGRTEPGRKDTPGEPEVFLPQVRPLPFDNPENMEGWGGITSANGNLSIPPNASAFPSAYPSDTLTHNQPKPQPCQVDFATHARRCRSPCTLAFHLPS